MTEFNSLTEWTARPKTGDDVRTCPSCGTHNLIRLGWHWRDTDDPTAPCYDCSLLTGRRSKHDSLDSGSDERINTSAYKESAREAIRLQERHAARAMDSVTCGAHPGLPPIGALPVRPKSPPRDPLADALTVARKLAWWDSKVEAKATAEADAVGVWSKYLTDDPEDRKRLLRSLSKLRTFDPAKKRAENARRAEQEKADRRATAGARKAALIAESRELRAQEAALHAEIDALVAQLPEKDRPPREPRAMFGCSDIGRKLLPIERELRRKLTENQARQTSIYKSLTSLKQLDK